MPVEPRGPAVCNGSKETGGKGEMIKAPIGLQDLRRSLWPHSGYCFAAICQGEGGTALAFLGVIRPRVQDEDFVGSLRNGEKERWGSRY
jgi:hypothetical protein